MRSSRTILVAAALTWLVAPRLATASDVEEQLRTMNERMAQLEAQLNATNEELAASKQQVEQQQGLIQELDEDRAGQSALSKFLSETEFSGAVAASYTYNFRHLGSNAVAINQGTTGGLNLGCAKGIGCNPGEPAGITAPFHSNSNAFQLDQFYLKMEKHGTAESRGIWGATLVFGTTADGQTGGDLSDNSLNTGDLNFLHEAYVGYHADVADGVNLVLGRYATPIGAETFLVDENWNVTRGLLWSLQPVEHTGAYISSSYGEGFVWKIGYANDYNNINYSTDRSGGLVYSLGWEGETVGVKVNGYYGSDVDRGPFAEDADTGAGRTNDSIGLLDFVLNWDPSENLATWLNFDYYWANKKNNPQDPDPGPKTLRAVYGLGVAGRYGITEMTGLALRYEWLFSDQRQFGDTDLMELTATVDHALTENLKVLVEGRYDWGYLDKAVNNFFTNDAGAFTNQGQMLGLVQMMYTF